MLLCIYSLDIVSEAQSPAANCFSRVPFGFLMGISNSARPSWTPCAFSCTPAQCVSGAASPGKWRHWLLKTENWMSSDWCFIFPEVYSVLNPCHLYLMNSSCIHPPPPALLVCFTIWSQLPSPALFASTPPTCS